MADCLLKISLLKTAVQLADVCSTEWRCRSLLRRLFCCAVQLADVCSTEWRLTALPEKPAPAVQLADMQYE